VRASDQYHAGIVVDDFDASLADLTALFGYEFASSLEVSTPVRLSEGERTTERSIDLRFTYSVSVPRIELIQSIPGTLWTPVAGSGIHHLGYWSDDLTSDSSLLQERGYALEAAGARDDGTAIWAYHRGAVGPRIELVSRELLPLMEQWWSPPAA
jgi:Glyoxalase/Bleomycin resistance protein/Dioxygenase superfamily